MEKSVETAWAGLYNGSMEVYVLNITPLARRYEDVLARLSPARREKALRLQSRDARLRSAGAGLLLERFLPGAEIRVSPRGKPYVPGGPEFSLSHSGELAALAVSDRPVGLDLERVVPVSDAVKRRVLSQAELSWLESAGEEGFSFLWTRKEAVLKCLGTGVDRPLRMLSVLPGEDPAPEGVPLGLYTTRYDNYMLSAASAGETVFVPRTVSAGELLK